MFYLDHLSKQRKIAAVITFEYNLPTNVIKINSIEVLNQRYGTMQFRKMSPNFDCKET